MEKLINKYADTFNENFPFFVCRNMTDEEIRGVIETCLKTGKPYTPEMDDEVLY